MKKMKKILVFVMAMAMILGMSVTSLASPITGDTVPTGNDTLEVTINNVGDTTILEAYRIIEPNYNNGFTGYSWINNDAVGETYKGKAITYNDDNQIVGLNDELIASLAGSKTFRNGLSDTNKKTATGNKISLNAGLWIILATDPTTATKVYNPMLVGVYYTSASDPDKDYPILGTGTIGDKWHLYADETYAKAMDVTGPGNTEKTVKESATGEVGSSKTYVLKGTVPKYSDAYFKNGNPDVVYALKDTWSGLNLENTIKVYVGASGTTELSEEYYAIEYYSDAAWTTKVDSYAQDVKSFKVALTQAGLKAISEETVDNVIRVEYTATIDEAAVKEVAENEFVLDYTNKPGEDKVSKDIDTVYTYTGRIDGAVKKVKEDGTTVLGGAKFTLYGTRNETSGALSDPFTSAPYETLESDDTNVEAGGVSFQGLEFEKDYYLQETYAPSGYSVNDTVYKVRCEYKTDATNTRDKYLAGEINMTEYNVVITNMDDNTSTTYTVAYDATKRVFGDNTKTTIIKNTRLSSLPSTGGIGTTIFTIGGCAIMIIAAGLFFASRRKSSK